MKKFLFALLLFYSTTAAAESCKQSALRLANDLNSMYKSGLTQSDIKKRFDYSKELVLLVDMYVAFLADSEPARGWTRSEYQQIAQTFAKELCK